MRRCIRRISAVLLPLTVAADLLPGIPAMASDTDGTVYVSPTGDDSAAGTQDAPVKTLQKAAELARTKHGAGGTVTIHVATGKYFMETPLTLGPEDSNVTYVADDGTVLTGSKDLGRLTWSTYHNGIYVADVPTGLGIDQLFVNGRQQILARYPNYSADQSLQGCTTQADIKARSTNWANPAGGYIRALHNRLWGGNSYKITGKATNALGLNYTWIGDNNRGSGMATDKVMVENIFEELDAEQEWFYDGTAGKLYLKPAADVTLSADTLVEGAVTTELICVVGVQDGVSASNITFDGLALENTKRSMFTGTYVPLMRSDWCVVRSGALFLQDAEHVTFQHGAMRNIGGNAVFMSGHNENNVIYENDIINVGSSGIMIAGLPDSCREPSFWGSAPTPEVTPHCTHKTTIDDSTAGPVKEHYPKNCKISNNHVKNVGIWEKQSSQVAISVASGIKVLHNTFNEGPRAGININDGTFGGHEITYNDVFDVQRETDDHGMFNSWGRDRFWSLGGYDTEGNNGARKELYSRLDAMTTITIHDNRMHFGSRVDGGATFGIDLDDGSSNYKIYNNLCLNMGIKLREGFHREVYNNILINGKFNLHCTFEDSQDEIYGNIVVKGNPYELAATNEGRFSVSKDVFEKNWYYDLGSKVTLPDFFENLGYISGSLVGISDPQFRAPSTNDYTVTNSEDAEFVGFENFLMDQFGKPDCAEQSPVYVKTEPDSDVDVLEPEEWLGATISGLNYAIMSATGAGSLNGVYFKEVPMSSLAYQYGFRTADVIHSVNGFQLTTKAGFKPKYEAIADGELVHLTIVRNQLDEDISFIRNDSDGADSFIDDRDAIVSYVPGTGWETASGDNFYENTLTYKNLSTGKDGVSVSLPFMGGRVILYGRKAANQGNYSIVIRNGAGIAVVDTIACAYNATQVDKQVVYDSGRLPQDAYTMIVTPQTGDYIIIDGFRVYSRTPVVHPRS